MSTRIAVSVAVVLSLGAIGAGRNALAGLAFTGDDRAAPSRAAAQGAVDGAGRTQDALTRLLGRLGAVERRPGVEGFSILTRAGRFTVADGAIVQETHARTSPAEEAPAQPPIQLSYNKETGELVISGVRRALRLSDEELVLDDELIKEFMDEMGEPAFPRMPDEAGGDADCHPRMYVWKEDPSVIVYECVGGCPSEKPTCTMTATIPLPMNAIDGPSPDEQEGSQQVEVQCNCKRPRD